MNIIESMKKLRLDTHNIYLKAIREGNNSAAFELAIIEARFQVEIDRQVDWNSK